jgi:cell division protein FtsB
MSFIKEIRTRARHVIGPVIGISAVTYFGFHAVQGDRGLMAWWKIRQHIEVASISLREVTKERHALEQRVRLLHPESLDTDMLEERARIMLNYGHIDDIIVIDQKRKSNG